MERPVASPYQLPCGAGGNQIVLAEHAAVRNAELYHQFLFRIMRNECNIQYALPPFTIISKTAVFTAKKRNHNSPHHQRHIFARNTPGNGIQCGKRQ